jgi:hypothetical protein
LIGGLFTLMGGAMQARRDSRHREADRRGSAYVDFLAWHDQWITTSTDMRESAQIPTALLGRLYAYGSSTVNLLLTERNYISLLEKEVRDSPERVSGIVRQMNLLVTLLQHLAMHELQESRPRPSTPLARYQYWKANRKISKLVDGDDIDIPARIREGVAKARRAAEAIARGGTSYRASPNEVTSRSIVDPLRRKDFATVWLSLHSTSLCSAATSLGHTGD